MYTSLSTDQLVELALEGNLESTSSSEVKIHRTFDSEGDLLTISINELKGSSRTRNTQIDTYVAQTTSVRSLGSLEKEESFNSGFTLTAKVTYDVITNTSSHKMYKLTGYEVSYSNVVGHYSFKELEMICGCYGDAYSDSSTRVGLKNETHEWASESISSNTPYSGTTGFSYYYNSGSYMTRVEGVATVSFLFSNETTLRTFTVQVPVVNTDV